MPAPGRIAVGLAGWGNPPRERGARGPGQSHLSHYARHFNCVEINSSFYRPHQAATYARWRDETPEDFRFSVKMPRSITHDAGLRRCRTEVRDFYASISHLRPKLAVVLVQLPPVLEFERRVAGNFFAALPVLRGVRLVCEPRHPSWFSPDADRLLRERRVSRVAADPVRTPGADLPGGQRRFAYFRWHGSPRMYYSAYGAERLAQLATAALDSTATDAWCVFDNTARYAAWDDAQALRALLASPPSAALVQVECTGQGTR